MSFVEPETYPGIRNDFESSFKALRALPVDIFLASHTNWFGMQRKLRARENSENPVAPFIDPEGYHSFIDRAEEQFLKELNEQQENA